MEPGACQNCCHQQVCSAWAAMKEAADKAAAVASCRRSELLPGFAETLGQRCMMWMANPALEQEDDAHV